MPTIRNVTALAAGAQNANVLQGSQFEFLGTPSRIQVYAIDDTDAPAVGGGVAEVEIFFGNRKAAGPDVPDDLLIDDFGAAGDRLVVRVSETGGALDVIVNTLVKITPMGM